jgi:flavin-dependent dehydrogenase
VARDDWDVVIVGAGAAGCTAAVHLPARTRALLLDRGDPAAGRCCGGLLNPDAREAMDRLGLEVPEGVRVRPEPQAVHAVDLDSGREQTYRRAYWNLDRAAFDAYLLERARRRATFRPHTRVAGLRREAAGVSLRLAGPGGETTVRASRVIAADGAGSRVRRLAFPERPMPPVMVAMQVRLAAETPPERHEVLFASGLTNFYAWAIPKAGAVLVGAAFGRARGARDRFEGVLAHFRERLGLDGPVQGRQARRLTRPGHASHLLAGGDRILLAGEAAGLVSPSSGEGLSFAVQTGAAAGAALGHANPGAAYARRFEGPARRVRRKFLKARVIFSAALRRWALRLPWCP